MRQVGSFIGANSSALCWGLLQELRRWRLLSENCSNHLAFILFLAVCTWIILNSFPKHLLRLLNNEHKSAWTILNHSPLWHARNLPASDEVENLPLQASRSASASFSPHFIFWFSSRRKKRVWTSLDLTVASWVRVDMGWLRIPPKLAGAGSNILVHTVPSRRISGRLKWVDRCSSHNGDYSQDAWVIDVKHVRESDQMHIVFVCVCTFQL